MKEPLVSIVMATYNGQAYLKEQIESIIQQTYSNLEIIIVDDNSRDDSVTTARSFATSDKRIKIYENSLNIGIVANFLKGLSYARGEYICFSDQDDYWRNDKIETLKRVIEKDKDIMLVYSDIEVCNECLDILYPSFWRVSAILPQKGSPKELALLKNISPGCAMMFRRKVKQVLERAPSSIPFMHDHFAFVVACGLGKVSYSKEKLIKYRQHTSNNIGAFYDSIINKERIIRDLRQKIEYLKSFYADELNLDLERMERFCKVLQNANLFTRLSFVDCYLFLRNSKPLNKLLGILDCLSPTLYNWLKKNAFLFSWTKRILFIAWIIIVLLFFTKEFVIFKIAKFLNTK